MVFINPIEKTFEAFTSRNSGVSVINGNVKSYSKVFLAYLQKAFQEVLVTNKNKLSCTDMPVTIKKASNEMSIHTIWDKWVLKCMTLIRDNTIAVQIRNKFSATEINTSEQTFTNSAYTGFLEEWGITTKMQLYSFQNILIGMFKSYRDQLSRFMDISISGQETKGIRFFLRINGFKEIMINCVKTVSRIWFNKRLYSKSFSPIVNCFRSHIKSFSNLLVSLRRTHCGQSLFVSVHNIFPLWLIRTT